MSIRLVMDTLFNHWLGMYLNTLEQSDMPEESSRSLAIDLARSVTSSCGGRLIRLLSDEEYHSFLQFVRISNRIADSEISDVWGRELSDVELDYAKVDLIASGLQHLAQNDICQYRESRGIEQEPATSMAYSRVLTDVLGFQAGFLFAEYRLNPDILPTLDLDDLLHWMGPAQVPPSLGEPTSDGRYYRHIRLPQSEDEDSDS